MPITLTEVRPGDLITAALWNLLLAKVEELDDRVDALSGSVPTGLVTVPNLFGQTLANASAMISLPTQQLVLGVVLNTAAQTVNPAQPTSASLLVLNQVPAAGTRTNPGSSVQLLVAAPAGTGTTPAPVVRINLMVPTTVAVGAQLEIRGENFSSVVSENTVTFPGREAVPTGASTTTSLFVVVPTAIAGAPTAPGQPTTANVPVVVSVTGRGQATGQVNISAPVPGQPTINPPPNHITNSTVPGTPVRVGQDAAIAGTNFGTDIGNVRVRFDDRPEGGVIPTSATGTQLIVRVPTDIPGLPVAAAGQPPNSRENVPVRVTVGALSANATVRIVRGST